MQYLICARNIAVTLVFCLSQFVAAQQQPQSTQSSPATSAETAIHAIVEQYYATWTRKNLDGFTLLWSPKSPEFEARKETTRKLFSNSKTIEAKNIVIRSIAAEGENARAVVAIQIDVTSATTGAPVAGFGKMNRSFHFVRERGAWMIWRELDAEDELAAAIAGAKTEPDRAGLLASTPELITAELWKALLRQVDAMRIRGDSPRALALLGVTRGIVDKLNDKSGVAAVLNAIGVVHYNQASYDLAILYWKESLSLYRELKDPRGIARVTNSIGNFHRARGDYGLALENYQQSLAAQSELGGTSEKADILINMGSVYRLQGDYDLALKTYQKSLELKNSIGEKGGPSVTILVNNIGTVWLLRGNFSMALEYFERSLQLAKESENKAGIARAFNNIGGVYYDQGDYQQALESFQNSLTLKRELEDKEGIPDTIGNIGGIFEALGDYGKALAYRQEALALQRAINNEAEVAKGLGDIGDLYRMQGDYQHAMDYLTQGLTQSTKLQNKPTMHDTLIKIGLVRYAQKDYKAALDCADRAAGLARETGARDALWTARAAAGKSLLAIGQFAEARAALDEAITIIESLQSDVAGGVQQQQSFFENKVSPYHAMVDLLCGQHKELEGLSYAERAKARVLLAVLQSGRINVTKAMTDQEQARERSLNNQMTSLNAKIERESSRQSPDPARLADLQASLQKARLEHEAFQTDLYSVHPELKVRRGQAPPLKIEEAVDLLDSRSALLEYVVADDETFLFVWTRNPQRLPELKSYRIGIKQDELVREADAFRRKLSEHDLDFHGAARQLYDLLLAPAGAQLAGKSNLIIVPDAGLWQLPFQALEPTPGRYLLQEAAVSYSYSIGVLREMVAIRDRNGAGLSTLLAVGNPAKRPGSAGRTNIAGRNQMNDSLPEAEAEVKTLAALYGPNNSRVYVGAQATEERFKAEATNFDVLHLATHAFLDNASPMYSHIVLSKSADSGNEDGMLEAWEIMNLTLKAKLVVLSACDTARGKVGAGEGVIGMMWAVFVAGCPTSVVSQWKVDSASTAELMLQFHRNLKSRDPRQSAVTKAEALRQAALKLMKSSTYRHPLYWAGFVLVGDPF